MLTARNTWKRISLKMSRILIDLDVEVKACLGFGVKVGLEARGCEIFLGHPKAAVFLIKKLYRNVGSKEDFKDRKMGLKIFIVGIDPECFKTSRNKI